MRKSAGFIEFVGFDGTKCLERVRNLKRAYRRNQEGTVYCLDFYFAGEKWTRYIEEDEYERIKEEL